MWMTSATERPIPPAPLRHRTRPRHAALRLSYCGAMYFRQKNAAIPLDSLLALCWYNVYLMPSQHDALSFSALSR